MPTTVRHLFSEFNISDFQKVNWGTNFNEKKQGVYLVSTSNEPDKHLGITDRPIFDEEQINIWVKRVPNFKVDGIPVNPAILKDRLSNFWFPDESILYIGKAPARKTGTGISKRVIEYFRTVIGDGGPHSGGQWIKSLKNLNTFTVYYGVCENPSLVEHQMLEFFMNNASQETILQLFDRQFPIPFANIKFKGNKNHGLKNQRL